MRNEDARQVLRDGTVMLHATYRTQPEFSFLFLSIY